MLKGRFFRRVVKLRAQFASTPELPFSECLTQEQIEAELSKLGASYRDRVYPPWATTWIFLSQVLGQDHSCREAVARYAAFRTARGLPACSTETGSYCDARQRVPEELLAQLTRQTSRELHDQALGEWKFHGRDVQMVDGSIVSMPDTPDNAAFFGKAQNQKGRVGFPLARIVVLICLATGAVLELAIGPYRGKRTGELSLFRSLQDRLKPGGILLGDRLFCTYCDIVRLSQRGVDCVFRLNAQRMADFRRGQRLGHDDHLVTWRKPTSCPDWLSAEDFAAVPAELVLRETRVRVTTPGCRVRSLVVVTTLTDHREFPPEEIAELFRQRGHAEVGPALDQISDANGRSALQDAGDGSQGNVDAFAGLQPAAQRHVCRRHRARPEAPRSEFQGDHATAQCFLPTHCYQRFRTTGGFMHDPPCRCRPESRRGPS